MAGGAPKRLPEAFQETSEQYWRYMKLSKADWADVFADLYRQVFGETVDAEIILIDAEARNALLAGYRKAERGK